MGAKSFRISAISAAALLAAGLVAYQVRAGQLLLYLDSRFCQNDEAVEGREGVTGTLRNARIVVKKAERRLLLYEGERLVATYRAGLGFAPVGHKCREGDGRTPEGTYYVCTKNPDSRFHLSLGLSYPNAEDAEGGLAAGRITREERDAIVAAITEKRVPPWKSALGGEIFIHGHGSKRDWTSGCIALDDSAVEELYRTVPLGTPVEILP